MGDTQEYKRQDGSTGSRPVKLATWRATSPQRELVEAIAKDYGGAVEEWADAPDGDQWQVTTEADALDVLIPPGDQALTQFFEMWSGGGCQRRCDGITEHLTQAPCVCPTDPTERTALASKGHACKPTSRLIVILPTVPDLGSWMIESHGYYSAVELAGTFDLLRMAAPAGAMLRARARIDQRSVLRDGKTNRFATLVLESPGVGFAALAQNVFKPELANNNESAGALPAAPTQDRAEPPQSLLPASSARREQPPEQLPPPALPPPEARVQPVDPSAPVVIQGQQLKAGDAARDLNARVKDLEPELQETLHNTLQSRGTDLNDADAGKILGTIEKQQAEAWLKRQRRANAAMGELGITDNDARHAFVNDATSGATSSTGRLTEAQCKLVVEAAGGAQ